MKRFKKGVMVAGVIIAIICIFVFSGSSSSERKNVSKRWGLLKIDTLVAINPAVAGERQLALVGE